MNWSLAKGVLSCISSAFYPDLLITPFYNQWTEFGSRDDCKIIPNFDSDIQVVNIVCNA